MKHNFVSVLLIFAFAASPVRPLADAADFDRYVNNLPQPAPITPATAPIQQELEARVDEMVNLERFPL